MLTSKGWGQSKSPEPSGGSQPPAPTRAPSAPAGPGGRGKRGSWEGSCLPGEGGGGQQQKSKAGGARGLRVCRDPPSLRVSFPLVTHPDRRRSLLAPAWCGDSCPAGVVVPKAGTAPPRPPPGTGAEPSRAGPPAAPQPLPAAFPGNLPPPCPGA